MFAFSPCLHRAAIVITLPWQTKPRYVMEMEVKALCDGSPTWAAIILDCLQLDPEERPTAAALKQRLQAPELELELER